MTGRPLACAVVVLAGAASGCSFVLDWEQRFDAGPMPDECAFKEPNDTIEAAAALLPTETGPAAICPTMDVDYYRFTVPADLQNVTISVSFVQAPMQDIDIELFDPANSNMSIAQGFSFVTPEQLICPGTMPTCPQLVTGDYILLVKGASERVNNAYTVSITITPP